MSLPKLELCAVHLLAKLSSVILSHSPRTSIYQFSILLDLSRVSDIHTITNDAGWRHVSSKDNPADCATRGITVKELRDSTLWWNGSKWLTEDTTQWSSFNLVIDPKITLEARSKYLNKIEDAHFHFAQENFSDLLERISSLMKLLRVTPYCRRSAYICQNPEVKFPNYLTSFELRNALQFG